MMLRLAIKSLRNRKLTAALSVLSIALAALLLLGVERIRSEARESFASTFSGTDLIVGARSSPVHLLLYSVFRIGNPTSNVRWESFQAISQRREVEYAIPISLGDSHRGFRVLATTSAYFEHYHFAKGRALTLTSGKALTDTQDAILGADVAEALKYRVGDKIVLAHGTGEVSFALHSERPFRVIGVLARTGTPVDRTVHVTLQGLEAVHGAHNTAQAVDPLAAALQAEEHALGEEPADTPQSISAFLLGLKSRGAALGLQRAVNEYTGEPLTAILPGPTLQELWDIVGVAEKTLRAVSALVVVVGLTGMLIALLTGLSERRREMAILRSVGARPMHIFGLMLGEAALLLEFSGKLVSEFLLVPWVGACIHTPPPPPNQIVHVKTDQPFEFTGLFTPIWVTGRMSAAASRKSLYLIDGSSDIDIGYSLQASQVEPYKQ